MTSQHGAPCWVNLMSHDMEETKRFYSAVLDWEFRPGYLGPEVHLATLDGMPVAGISELAASWSLPVTWMVYFQVDDADQTAGRIRERGATVAAGPLPLGEGRAVMAADPYGAVFAVWQGELPEDWGIGAGKAPVWLELRTRDAFASALFYGEVFDWASGSGRYSVSYEEADDVILVRTEGRAIAGLRGGQLEEAADPRVRPEWWVHFRVPDVERAVSAASEAGGDVLSPPEETSLGPKATLRDSQGAVFSVLAV